MRLSCLNPVSLFLGPIFQKEVRTAGRKRGTYVMRFLYGLTLLALVGIAFAGIQSEMAFYTGVRRLQRLQTLAPAMAIMIVWFQFIALCLAAPVFTGPAICDEKRARTLPALMTTPLSAAQIILGTLSSRVVQLVILALLATPLLLAIRIFGGLDARIILAATCMGLSAALLAAALGLMYSVWHKRGTAAAIFALLSLCLVMGAPTGVEGIIYYIANESAAYSYASTPQSERYPFHENILSTCTPAVMGSLTVSAAMGGGLKDMELECVQVPHWSPYRGWHWTPFVAPMWAVNTGYNLFLAGLVTAYSTRALRRVMLKEAAEGQSTTEQPRKKQKKARTPAASPASAPDVVPAAPEPEGAEREAARSRDVSDRPILWRETRQATFGSRRWFRIIGVLTALGLAALYWWAGTENGLFSITNVLSNEGMHAAMMILGAIAIMIQPVFMTTGSIAGEREARTWETLLTTPLTGRQIMLGKLAGALRVQWFLPTVVLAHFTVASLTGYVNPLVLPLLAMTYIGPTLFFSATGQLFSLFFRRAVAAAACNLLLALALWMGTWIALGLGSWFLETGEGKLFDYFGSACYVLDPVAMAVSAGESTVHRWHNWNVHDTFTISGPHDHTLSAGGFTLLTVGVFAFYCLGAIAAMSIAVTHFTRLSGRTWVRGQPGEGSSTGRILAGLFFCGVSGGFGGIAGGVVGAILSLALALLLLGLLALLSRRTAPGHR